MNNFSLKEFQEKVDDILIRHKSILDILTKLQESNAKVNRAVAKSATYCGCIQIQGKKQEIPQNVSYSELKSFMSNHIHGELCDACKEKIQEEISTNLFYITALCNLFNVDMENLLNSYYDQLKALGKYGLL